jgi:hypothetical protein
LDGGFDRSDEISEDILSIVFGRNQALGNLGVPYVWPSFVLPDHLRTESYFQMSESPNIDIEMIRLYAHEMVGPCTDYQISFCGVMAEKIPVQVSSLELLSEKEIEALTFWIEEQYLHSFSTRYGPLS